jgi:hypothetical protein
VAIFLQFGRWHKVRQGMVCLLLPWRSKRATFYIDLHGRVCCFVAAKPGRREKARYVFALGPVVPTMHIQPTTVNPIQRESRGEVESPTPVKHATISTTMGDSMPQQLRQYCSIGFEISILHVVGFEFESGIRHRWHSDRPTLASHKTRG